MPKANQEEEGVITSAEDLENNKNNEETESSEDEEEDDVNSQDEKSSDKNNEETESSEDEEEDDVNSQEEEEEDDTKTEEIKKLVEEGKRIQEYKKTHPGWDPFLMERDYRKKTAELKKLKKQIESEDDSKESDKPEKKIDLSDVNSKDVELVEKILKAKGYVSREELEKREAQKSKETYQQTKKRVINNFIENYPEYHPSNDTNDEKWNTLVQEFSLYKTPKDPNKIKDLLIRAHNQVSGSKKSISSRDASKLLAQKKVNKIGTERGGGSGASKNKGKANNKLPSKAGYLKGFSEEELKDIFN